MPDGPGGRFRRTRRRARVLLAVTVVVVAIDLVAGVLTVVSSERVRETGVRVSAGLRYNRDLATVIELVLDAQGNERGYLLTGSSAYLGATGADVARARPVLAAIRSGGESDPTLRHDFVELIGMLRGRLQEIDHTVSLYQRGAVTRAVAAVAANHGSRLTDRIRGLVGEMQARSGRLVASASQQQTASRRWAARAGLAALLCSVLLLVTMLALLRTYFVTEDARRASRLAQLEAERLNRAKSGFLSRVSHELRTPLNAILGFGQLLERGPLSDDERETVDHILTAGRHLLGIVDDLLDLSRIEAEELRLSLEPVQLAEALGEVRALVAHAASQAAVGVRQRPVDTGLFVRADRQRLIQILLNLASNAVKYNRRGGNVVISAMLTDSGTVRIEVADSGTGIDGEEAERLFVPFERLGAEGRGIEGTGLGLALARGLAQAMGGSLELSSTKGVGTTVTVELPLAEAPARPAERRGGQPRHGAGHDEPQGLRAAISVVYIEDNPSNVRLVEQILGLSSDIGLATAGTGTAGIELARELEPELILLDLHLPDIPGEQVLAAVRADPTLAHTAVVIVSADASPAQARRLLAAGADGYLSKPFDIDQLLAAVRNRGTPQPQTADSDAGDGEEPLDGAIVAALRSLAANAAVGPGQLGRMLDTFHEDALATLIGLHDAVADDRLSDAVREAHLLAGAAGAVGAGSLRRLARTMEMSAREGNSERLRSLDRRLNDTLATAWAALRTEFDGELRLAASAGGKPPR